MNQKYHTISTNNNFNISVFKEGVNYNTSVMFANKTNQTFCKDKKDKRTLIIQVPLKTCQTVTKISSTEILSFPTLLSSAASFPFSFEIPWKIEERMSYI